MDNKQRKVPAYARYNGFAIPAGFSVEQLMSAFSYEAQDEDIFVCTYPKCGTTWMTYIVYLLMHDGEPLVDGQSLGTHVPFLEKVGSDVIKKLPPPRVIKSHFPYNHIPKNVKSKYIYVARNPKDCVVSFYHHTQGFPAVYNFSDGSMDDFFEVFMEGEVDFGDYFESLLSWHPHLNDPNVLFLTYEDLKKDPVSGVKKVAEFLGEEYVEKIKDESMLHKVVHNSNIEQMRKDQYRWHMGKRPENSTTFIRKGENGDWRNVLSQQQSERIDKKFYESMKDTMFEHLWDEYM